MLGYRGKMPLPHIFGAVKSLLTVIPKI